MAVIQQAPGKFFIPELGRVINITDVRQGDFYDTVAQPSGAIAAGRQLKVFDVTANKNKQHIML